MATTSILNTIKQMLGLAEDYTPFDTDIIVGINTAFMQLQQEGIGPSTPFSITDSTAVWSDFLESHADQEAVKTIVYLRVKSVFDPPSSSSVQQAYDALIQELEWRLYAFNENSKES